MKNLLVIGNGFDLHCKLNSKFNHFFESEVLRQKQDNSFELIKNKNVWYILLFYSFYQTDKNIFHPLSNNNQHDIKWMNVEEFIKSILTKKAPNAAPFYGQTYVDFLNNFYINKDDYSYYFNADEARILKNRFQECSNINNPFTFTNSLCS